MKKTKQGVSLIVLVITIIIMIILASAIIITLSNSDIIDRANEAVEKTDLQEVQNIASIAWSEAYLDGKTTKAELQAAVESALTKNKVDKSKYEINVTTKGVKVSQTLGYLIKGAADYGKTIDYTVTVDVKKYEYNEETGESQHAVKSNVTLSNWQVFYEDEENGYVFLIAPENVGSMDLYLALQYETSLTTTQKNLYGIFNLGRAWNEVPFGWNVNVISYLVANYDGYANRALYGEEYVVGAIGGPTIELLAKGYNEKYNTTAITPVIGTTYDEENDVTYGLYGYSINEIGTTAISGLTKDDMYTLNNYWLASPSGETGADCYVMYSCNGGVSATDGGTYSTRPVVCLKSDIPAKVGTTTDFSLVVTK